MTAHAAGAPGNRTCGWCGSPRHEEAECPKRQGFELTRKHGTVISPPEYEQAHEDMRGMVLYMKRERRRFVVAELSPEGKLKMVMYEEAPKWWPVIGGAS